MYLNLVCYKQIVTLEGIPILINITWLILTVKSNVASYSNSEIPAVYLEAGKKRHPAMRKPKLEIPPEVKKVMEEMELEEEMPDEQQLEALEDIWLKAGELGE